MNDLPDNKGELIFKFLSGELNAAEQAELDAWRAETPDNELFFTRSVDPDHLVEGLRAFREADRSEERVRLRIKEAVENGERAFPQQSVVKRMPVRRTWLRYAAAVALLAGVTAYWLLSRHQEPAGTVAQQAGEELQDVQPGGNKAVLTLADGTTVVLDSASSGMIASQGAARVLKLDEGALAYNAGGVPLKEGMPLYNTVSTPRGGQYQVILPDGSKVWLNAASSLRFPVVFNGKERQVELTGEAYFEIAATPRQPFYVTTGPVKVEVLGTQFNMSTYADETASHVTLVEGSVRVSYGTDKKVLLPGQQALLPGQQVLPAGKQVLLPAPAETIKVVSADINKVLAWKRGYFNFDDLSLEEVMRLLSRWYNIEVVYEKGVPNIYFEGEISRSMPLSGMLKALQDMEVNFKITEGKRIVVYPKK